MSDVAKTTYVETSKFCDWLDEREIDFELHEDPYNPRRDTVTVLPTFGGPFVVGVGDSVESPRKGEARVD